MCYFLVIDFPTQSASSSFSLYPLACSLGTAQTFDAPSACRMQLCRCIVWGFVGLSLEHLHSITRPQSGSIFNVDPSDHFLRGPVVVLLMRSTWVALP